MHQIQTDKGEALHRCRVLKSATVRTRAELTADSLFLGYAEPGTVLNVVGLRRVPFYGEYSLLRAKVAYSSANAGESNADTIGYGWTNVASSKGHVFLQMMD